MFKNLLEKLSGKKIFVTGASGFLGGRLIQILTSNPDIQIKALVHNYSNAIRIARYPIDIVLGDIVSSEEMKSLIKGCDVVFHCAYGNHGDWKAQRRVNVEGTKNIIEASIDAKIKRLVYVSTMVVYGIYSSGIISEYLPYKYSKNSYSDTKIDAEKLLLQYQKNVNLPVSVIQPAIIYGPWAPTFTKYPLNLMKEGRIVLPLDIEGICNPVYIDDVVQSLLLAALKTEAIGEKFIISGQEQVSWNNFYSYYERMLNKEAIVYQNYEEILKNLKNIISQKRTLARIIKIIRSEDTIKFLLDLPLIDSIYSSIRQFIPEEKRKFLRKKITSSNSFKKKQDVNFPNKIIYEDIVDYKIRRAFPKANIGKAQKILGYKPQFNLNAGMSKTYEWAKWANLL